MKAISNRFESVLLQVRSPLLPASGADMWWRSLTIAPDWCRLGKIGKEIEEAVAEVSKLEQVYPTHEYPSHLSIPRTMSTMNFTMIQLLHPRWYRSGLTISHRHQVAHSNVHMAGSQPLGVVTAQPCVAATQTSEPTSEMTRTHHIDTIRPGP